MRKSIHDYLDGDSTAKANDLLPCPFCGGEAKPDFTDEGTLVQCQVCDATILNDIEPHKYIETWNTRLTRQWRPIETAPKDGTKAVLFGTMREPNFGGSRQEITTVHQGYFSSKRWQTGTFWMWLDVTHWQPLPTPPQEGE